MTILTFFYFFSVFVSSNTTGTAGNVKHFKGLSDQECLAHHYIRAKTMCVCVRVCVCVCVCFSYMTYCMKYYLSIGKNTVTLWWKMHQIQFFTLQSDLV